MSISWYTALGNTKKERIIHLGCVPRITTVFTSGKSQAVRLPKEIHFHSRLVFIGRSGSEIVLRERRPTFGEALRNFKPQSGEKAWLGTRPCQEYPSCLHKRLK